MVKTENEAPPDWPGGAFVKEEPWAKEEETPPAWPEGAIVKDEMEEEPPVWPEGAVVKQEQQEQQRQQQALQQQQQQAFQVQRQQQVAAAAGAQLGEQQQGQQQEQQQERQEEEQRQYGRSISRNISSSPCDAQKGEKGSPEELGHPSLVGQSTGDAARTTAAAPPTGADGLPPEELATFSEPGHFNKPGTWSTSGWTLEEDQKLLELVNYYGAQSWIVIADELPGRVGKQCRER